MDTTIDPTIKNLVRAIGRAETGGSKDPYNAKGASGEFGRYQYMPATWKEWAKEHLGDENAEMSMENQNKVAYNQVKKWKDQGLTPAQIASKWNSGGENTYKTQTPGKNEYGVYYDTPGYVRKVSQYYKELAGNTGQELSSPEMSVGSSSPEMSTQDSQSQKTPGGFMGTLSDIVGGGKLAQGFGQSIANNAGAQDSVIKANDQSMDIQANLIEKIKANKELGKDTTRLENALSELTQHISETGDNITDLGTGGLSNKQVLGSAAQLAVGFIAPEIGKTIAPGLNAGGRILGGAASGAALGASSAIANGEENVGKAALIGGIAGGAFSAIGEGIARVADKLPGWFVKSSLPKLNPENKDYATEMLTGGKSVAKNLDISSKAKQSYYSAIKSVLGHPEIKGEVGNLDDVVKGVVDSFPDSGLTPEEVMDMAQDFAPLQKKIVQKVFNGTATLDEQYALKTALDTKIYPSIADKINPKLTDTKKVLKVLTDKLRDNIKTTAPSTEPLLAMYSKEINLNNALKYAQAKISKGMSIDMGDILAGIEGGIPGIIGKRVARSAAVKIGAAKAVKAVAPTVSSVGRMSQVPLVSGTSQLLNR